MAANLIPLIYTGDYNTLVKAIYNDDIDTFRSALHSVSKDEKSKIFEVACRTPGSGQFIDECISAGCDLNGDDNKRPIMLAVESLCEENVAALLKHPKIDVNADKSSLKHTPLHALTEQVTDDNCASILPLIKLLVQYGASVDLPDFRDKIPIMNILTHAELNMRNQEMILRSFNLENNVKINAQWDFIRLLFLLKNKNENDFIAGLKQAGTDKKLLKKLFTASIGVDTLLTVAAREDLTDALKKMIDLGADVNFIVVDEKYEMPMSAAQCACDRGHWKSLDLLLKAKKLNVNAAPLLHTVVQNFRNDSISDEHVDYEKCLDMLLDHPDIDIDLLSEYDNTALHCAIMWNKSVAAEKLLKRGAFIGSQNTWNDFTISRIDPLVLEKHFDSCITTNNLQMNDSTFEIEFDFKNLVPNVSRSCRDATVPDEMNVIEYMSNTNELKHLTMHPLISSWLSLKWNGMAPFFYVNLCLCVVYALITLAYIMLFYNYHEENTVLRVLILVFNLYIAFREVIQLQCSPRIYLRCSENYFEWTMITVVMLVLLDIGSNTWRRTFAAASILLIAIEIFLLAGSLPFWSFCTHYVMLKTVIWSFLKSLLLYAIIPLAFSLSFFTLLQGQLESGGEGEGDDSDADINKFSHIGLAIMKTLVMTTGEFDAASIYFRTNAFSYIIFTIFMFIVAIVLLNLLNGLAVSDTQAIKSKAELTNFIGCVQVMACYERVLTTCYPVYLKVYPFSERIKTFEELKKINRITVAPNNHNHPNRIQMHIPRVMFRNLRMFIDSKIVKVALQVLEKKRKERLDMDEKDEFAKRITKMENSLESISNKLNDVLNNMIECTKC